MIGCRCWNNGINAGGMTARKTTTMTIDHADKLTRIESKVDDIHKRLFVDNGEPCMQSKVRRCNDLVNCVVFIVGALVVAMIGVIVELLLK